MLARLQALPAFLETAAAVLTEPDSVFVGMGESMIPGAIALIQDGLDDPALDLAVLDELELERARREAVESLETFGDALAEMRGRAGTHFAIGRELFDRKLHTAHMICGKRRRAAALRGAAARGRDFERSSRSRGRSHRARRGRRSQRSCAWTCRVRDSALDEYREAMEASRHFTISRELMPVPEHGARGRSDS